MKQLRLALLVFVSATGLLHAEDEEENRAPPTDIPDFSNLDEYVYQAKSTLFLSMRRLSGAKTSFSGTGKLLSPEDIGPVTGPGFARNYHDGVVNPDSRVAARTDGSGNPIIDPVTSGQVFDPIPSDGRTNSWGYGDARQVTADGMIAFHSYSMEVTDPTIRRKEANSANGIEVAVARDMGSVFHTRAKWSLLAGMSISDISAHTLDKVQSQITTITDLYSLDGQVAPAAPYTAPSSTSITVVDGAGTPVLGSDGSTQIVSVDTTVYLGNQPANRSEVKSTDTSRVSNLWKVKGAYFTFRAGPVLTIPITTRLHADFSAGFALLYAGTDYTVTQTFTPEIGADITDTTTSYETHVLPGYFADASLQFDLTEHTGFFAGAAFQGAGSYTQKVDSDTVHYATKIDLGKQQGMRAGMTIRF